MNKNENIEISIVSPVYKSEDLIDELINQLIHELENITSHFEIILIDDDSPDNSWMKIKTHIKDKRVKALKLSRNFGQHHAITAGLRFATGKWVVVMDCDLQDPPSAIKHLYKKAQEGFDIVLAKRVEREDNFFRLIASQINHSVFSFLSGIKTDRSFGNFGIYKSIVIKNFNKMNEQARSFSLLVHSLGFNKTSIEVKKHARFSGKSSYSFLKLLNYGINATVSHSNKPLIISINFGFLISLFSFLIAVNNIIAKLYGLNGVEGFTSTIFSIWFSTGIIMMMLGTLGLYIGKIYDEVKKRPLFVVKEEINLSNKDL